MAWGVEQLQPVDAEVCMLHQRHRGPPFLPTPRTPAGIELRAQKADDYFVFVLCLVLMHSFLDK